MTQKVDLRYVLVRCVTCGHDYQNIDFGCALHVHSCAKPQRPDSVALVQAVA